MVWLARQHDLIITLHHFPIPPNIHQQNKIIICTSNYSELIHADVVYIYIYVVPQCTATGHGY